MWLKGGGSEAQMKFRGNYRWIEAGKVEGAKSPTFIIHPQEREFGGSQCEKCAHSHLGRARRVREGANEYCSEKKIDPLSRAGEHIARGRL